ncbi:response regulator transcription factor [Owenweeksia hongkongensis]|uniref:response regulator transcription factor n=1 Tax=Owenweeksia hongkongensis TaxID=253245 RepID=UPI003A8C9A6D
MKVLIIEDQLELLADISTFLKGQGYQCEIASTFNEGEDKIALYEYEAVILDIGLPGGSGLDLLKQLKAKNSQTSILILSAKDSLDDKLVGLQIGADDYLTKPFHMAELNARIHALVRRNLGKGSPVIQFEEISLNTISHQVVAGHTPLDLTNKEYQLLEYFLINPNRVLSKQDLAEHLLGDNADLIDNFDFLYVHMKNLRRKIKAATETEYIATIYGLGYKLCTP